MARPPALFNSDVRVCKAPFHILHCAVVSGRRPDHVWFLPLSVQVAGAKDGCSGAVAEWERLHTISDSIDFVIPWVSVTRCERLPIRRRHDGRVVAFFELLNEKTKPLNSKLEMYRVSDIAGVFQLNRYSSQYQDTVNEER